ncbi:unnamed protein product [Effrenium voratum]|nr:unnamed protein product [Effrenium voratum]
MCRTDRQELRHAKIDVSLEALLSRACAALLSEDKDKEAVCVNHTGSFECDADLNRYSFLQELPLARRMELIELGSTDAVLNRAMGAMVGMAVGDALGAPLECLHAQATSRVRLWCWWFRGYNNAFAKDRSRSASYGLGSSVAKSLAEMLRLLPGQAPTEEVQSPEAGNGNGGRRACMRLSALLVFLMTNALRSHHSSVKNFLDSALQEYWEQGIMHLGYGKLRQAQSMHKFGPGYDKIKCLITSTPRSAVERCWDWRSTSLDVLGTLEARGHSYNGYPVSARNFGSFAVDGLAVAIWSMYHTTSFDEAVGKA